MHGSLDVASDRDTAPRQPVWDQPGTAFTQAARSSTSRKREQRCGLRWRASCRATRAVTANTLRFRSSRVRGARRRENFEDRRLKAAVAEKVGADPTSSADEQPQLSRTSYWT